jgi:predicted phosphodiesterase
MNNDNPVLAIASDLHGHFDHMIRTVNEARPKALVLAGDLDLEQPLDTVLAPLNSDIEVFYIHGNHDTDRPHWWENLVLSRRAQSIHGKVVDIGGISVAGLGGVFRQEIWHPDAGNPRYPTRESYRQRRPPKDWDLPLKRKHHSSIWWEDYERLFDQHADVLVTHEAPAVHRHGVQALDDLAEALEARWHFHGHHHEAYRAKSRNGVTVVGIAQAGVVDQHGRPLFGGLKRDGIPWSLGRPSRNLSSRGPRGTQARGK